MTRDLHGDMTRGWAHRIVLLLMVVQFFGVFSSGFSFWSEPVQDAVHYHSFIDSLVQSGELNFSESGLIGATLPALFLELLGFPQSFVLTQLVFSLLSIPMFYAVTARLFRSRLTGVLGTTFFSMMPEFIFSGFYGQPQGVVNFLLLIVIYLVMNRNGYSYLFFGWSLISKPFSLALLPFFVWKKRMRHFLIGVGIFVCYLLLQFNVQGSVVLGVHPDWSLHDIFTPVRLIYNLASVPPLVLSIHNYQALSEYNGWGETSMGDRIHTSPLIITFALFSLLYLRKYFRRNLLFVTLVSFTGLALGLGMLVPFVESVYLQSFVIGCLWISLVFYERFPWFIPITTGTLMYQYLFTFLNDADLWLPPDGYWLFFPGLVGFVVSIQLTKIIHAKRASSLKER